MLFKCQNFRNEETKYLFRGDSDGQGGKMNIVKGHQHQDSCGDGTVMYLHYSGESFNCTYDEIVQNKSMHTETHTANEKKQNSGNLNVIDNYINVNQYPG